MTTSKSMFDWNIYSNRTRDRSLYRSAIRQAAALSTLTCLLLAGASANATEIDSLDFEVGRCRNTLCVWVNLADLLSSDRLSRLKEGVPLSIECRSTLLRPRRLWGEVTIAEEDWTARLGFRRVTEDYVLTSAGREQRVFSSLAPLHRFLSDSVIINLTPVDSLNQEQFHRVRIRMTLVWLTSLNLSPPEESSGSPIRFLFEQFLSVSGYGRHEFDIESESFSVRRLPEHDQQAD